MNHPIDDNQGITSDLWRMWERQGRMRRQAATRKLGLIAGTVIALAGFCTWFYLIH